MKGYFEEVNVSFCYSNQKQHGETRLIRSYKRNCPTHKQSAWKDIIRHVTPVSYLILLSSSFPLQIDDHTLPRLLDILQTTVLSFMITQTVRLKLLLQCTEGYIGLFLHEYSALWMSDMLKKFAAKVEEELGKDFILFVEHSFHLD